MLVSDLRGMFFIALKDLRAYYLKPPNISWGILFPFAFMLAFTIRNPGEIRNLVPGLIGLTILFGTSSMEATVIVFERRIGALERLILAPISLPSLLAGKLIGGMVFGLTITIAVLAILLTIFGVGGINWLLLIVALLLSSAVFSTLGAFVSVAVKEIFEAQTLANFIRFPMIFLGGVFVPVNSLPIGLQIIARFLPLTYSVEIIQSAMRRTPSPNVLTDIIVLVAFIIVFYALAVRTLARSLN